MLLSLRSLSLDWRGQLSPRHSYTGPFKYPQPTFQREGPQSLKSRGKIRQTNMANCVCKQSLTWGHLTEKTERNGDLEEKIIFDVRSFTEGAVVVCFDLWREN